MTTRYIHRATLQTWLSTGTPGQSKEFALLDLREEEVFAKGQPLFATNLPLRRFRSEVGQFVPRRSVPVVLVDEDNGVAEAAATILVELGYTDINILSGGIAGWLADSPNGLPTFDIAGNIFTVAVADQQATPALTVAELKDLQDKGTDVVVIDTRTPPEYEKAHVPGSRNLPGGELLLRFLDTVPSPDTLVVVTCAWLARAITGAETLIAAKVPNRVAYLVEGTNAWAREVGPLASGADEVAAQYSAGAQQFGALHALHLAGGAFVAKVGRDQVAEWLADDSRTTYLLDVQLPEAYAARHLAGSVSAQAGQLLAVSHRTLAVRGARVVLVDNDADQVRAVTAAFWLRQRGWSVSIYDGQLSDDIKGAAEHLKEVVPA